MLIIITMLTNGTPPPLPHLAKSELTTCFFMELVVGEAESDPSPFLNLRQGNVTRCSRPLFFGTTSLQPRRKDLGDTPLFSSRPSPESRSLSKAKCQVGHRSAFGVAQGPTIIGRSRRSLSRRTPTYHILAYRASKKVHEAPEASLWLSRTSWCRFPVNSKASAGGKRAGAGWQPEPKLWRDNGLSHNQVSFAKKAGSRADSVTCRRAIKLISEIWRGASHGSNARCSRPFGARDRASQRDDRNCACPSAFPESTFGLESRPLPAGSPCGGGEKGNRGLRGLVTTVL